MNCRVAVAASGLSATLLLWTGSPAAAHGVGSRGDLPLPFWQFAWGAAFAVLISFAALGLLWSKPRLEDAARVRPFPSSINTILRGIGSVLRLGSLFVFGVVLWAGLFGIDNSGVNIAPVAVFVILWVGGQILSALAGDVWRVLSPFDTLVMVIERVNGRRSDPDRATGSAGWLSVLAISGFLWLELAYHSPSAPRVLGWSLLGYTIVMVGLGVSRGRAWLRANEAFAVLFGLLAQLAAFARSDAGRLGVRVPFSALSRMRARPSTVTFIVVVLGSTTFDGMESADFWADLTDDTAGWGLTALSTAGMLTMIAAVGALYLGASFLVGRATGLGAREAADAFSPSLVPILFAYAVAHYFSLFVFEGQNFLIQASDPFGQGWDLFGTQDNRVDFLIVSTATIAWVQALSIVIGHVVGVMAAHDRAVQQHSQEVAIRSQYPLLAVMVAYTVVGLTLLLNA